MKNAAPAAANNDNKSPTERTTMEITLESLGLTKDELSERIIDKICHTLLNKEYKYEDDSGNEQTGFENTDFAKTLRKLIEQRIEATITGIAEKHVLPNVSSYIENLCLQKTNSWGEKVGKPVTFVEYLVQRAEAYLVEEVNYEGKTKEQAGGYSWNKSQTRIAHLIHQHLHYSIEAAMKKALEEATGQVAAGIAATAKIQLEEISKKLKVTTKTE